MTSTPTVADGDSQTSRFEFLLLRNCLHPQRDLVLCSLHRLTPQALRFLRVEYQTEFFVVLILGLDCPLPCPLFPVYLFFFPVAVVANLLIRVYVHIVAGGSLTNYIVTQSRPKRTGFLPNFSDDLRLQLFLRQLDFRGYQFDLILFQVSSKFFVKLN